MNSDLSHRQLNGKKGGTSLQKAMKIHITLKVVQRIYVPMGWREQMRPAAPSPFQFTLAVEPSEVFISCHSLGFCSGLPCLWFQTADSSYSVG